MNKLKPHCFVGMTMAALFGACVVDEYEKMFSDDSNKKYERKMNQKVLQNIKEFAKLEKNEAVFFLDVFNYSTAKWKFDYDGVIEKHKKELNMFDKVTIPIDHSAHSRKLYLRKNGKTLEINLSDN